MDHRHHQANVARGRLSSGAVMVAGAVDNGVAGFVVADQMHSGMGRSRVSHFCMQPTACDLMMAGAEMMHGRRRRQGCKRQLCSFKIGNNTFCMGLRL